MTEALVGETARPVQGPAEITPDGIIDAVGEYYGFNREQLLGEDRSDSALSDARAITFTLMSDHTPLTPKKIAEMAERGPVSALIRRVHRDAEEDPRLQEHLEMLARAAAGEPLAETLTTWSDLVTTHYRLSLDEITTMRTPRALEARQVMAHLLMEKTVLHPAAVARLTGYSRAKSIGNALDTLTQSRHKDPDLDRRVELLETGELPEAKLTEDEIIDRVGSYYGVDREDIMGTETKDRFTRPRYMALQLLVSELGYDHQEAGRVVGRDYNPREHILNFEERLASDPNLRRQRRDILEDPKTVERGPIGQRMLKTVCDFYGVEPEELSSGHTAFRFLRPRSVTAYLLQRQFGLSSAEITELLGRNEHAVLDATHRIESELETNPLLVAEVKYLDRPKRIRGSINDRIIMRVAEATGMDPEEISSGRDAESMHARQMTMALMAERGHMSPIEVARLFGLTNETMTYRAVNAIGYHAPNDPLLSQQMDYVRRGLFSERRDSFAFSAEAMADLEANASDPDALPKIDENLVHPEIREQVYRIVRRTAAFYGVSAADVIGRVNDFETNRARRAAAYLCRRARTPAIETAICFDARAVNSLPNLADSAEQEIEDHAFFAEEIRAIRGGERRRDMLAETLTLAAEFYDMDESEIIHGNDARAKRARFVLLSVIDEQALTTYENLATFMETSWQRVAGITYWARKRLEDDVRMRAEVDYLTDPKGSPRPPGIEEVLSAVSQALGVDKRLLREPTRRNEVRTAKRMTAYILAEEVSLPQKDIARLLGSGSSQVASYIGRTREEIAASPRRALEVDWLKPANSVSMSMATRIVQHVTGLFELKLDDLSTLSRAPDINKAHKMVVNLLQRANFSVSQVGVLLSMPEATVKELTNGSFVEPPPAFS